MDAQTARNQEARSRRRFKLKPTLTSGLFAGAIMFIMSGGGPWSTAGTMNAIMGRDVKTSFIVLLLGHFALAMESGQKADKF